MGILISGITNDITLNGVSVATDTEVSSAVANGIAGAVPAGTIITVAKNTAWIWEKYNRNVVMLGDLTADEFRAKYADIIAKQEEARALINELGGN